MPGITGIHNGSSKTKRAAACASVSLWTQHLALMRATFLAMAPEQGNATDIMALHGQRNGGEISRVIPHDTAWRATHGLLHKPLSLGCGYTGINSSRISQSCAARTPEQDRCSRIYPHLLWCEFHHVSLLRGACRETPPEIHKLC
ncbi:hypothetical protein MHYP_G00214800 [Metynnis hypsauchen]